MRVPAAAPLAVAVALGTGCEPPARTLLPTWVSIVAHVQPHGYVSLLVDLQAPRRRPVVRVARGAVSFDGSGLWEVVPGARVLDDGRRRAEVRVRDLLGTGLVVAQVAADADDPPDVALARLEPHVVTVRVTGAGEEARWAAVDLDQGDVAAVEAIPPLDRWERYGPDRGFAVALQGHRLVLALPHAREGEAVPLLDPADALIGVHWIPEATFSPAVEEALDRRFKMAGSLVARALPATADGDLDEWSGDPSFAVDSVDQALSGEAAWHGSRDGSFSVAARLSEEALCVAMRIRDDDLIPGRDRVTLWVDGARHDAAVPVAPTASTGEDFAIAFTDRVSFGVGLEACARQGTWEARDGIVPFRVLFHDTDSDGETTVMATAPDVPWPALAGVRVPRRAPAGAPPPR